MGSLETRELVGTKYSEKRRTLRMVLGAKEVLGVGRFPGII